MDADPKTVADVLREMRAAGKGIVGMKILGQGDMRSRQDEALNYALSLELLDAFTIGAESKAEQQDLIRRIAAVAYEGIESGILSMLRASAEHLQRVWQQVDHSFQRFRGAFGAAGQVQD